jgi:hypothetical protein
LIAKTARDFLGTHYNTFGGWLIYGTAAVCVTGAIIAPDDGKLILAIFAAGFYLFGRICLSQAAMSFFNRPSKTDDDEPPHIHLH